MRLMLLLLAALAIVGPGCVRATRAEPPWTRCADDADAAGVSFGQNASYAIIPGLTWDGWRVLLGQDWSPTQLQQPEGFDAQTLIDASHRAPSFGAFSAESGLYPRLEAYRPLLAARPDQEAAYGQAARLYHAGNWRAAEAEFATISSARSPYRAAAAYSAARAAINAGDIDAGIRRIAALLADPADREMYQAAHHLIGTLAANTLSPALLGARLAEISHLLMAPSALLCREASLRELALEANDDLNWIRIFAFPTNEWQNGPTYTPQRQAVFAAIGQRDPVIDLAAVLSIPSPYATPFWTDPFYPRLIRVPGFSVADQSVLAMYDMEAATRYARAEARTGHNPLWVLALAQRTADMADLPVIRATMVTVLLGQNVLQDRQAVAAWRLPRTRSASC